MAERDPYHKHIVPQSTWELLTWVYREPSRVISYVELLESRWQKKLFVLRLHMVFCTWYIAAWFIGILIVLVTDLPSRYPSFFSSIHFSRLLSKDESLWPSLEFFFELSVLSLFPLVTGGVVIGLTWLSLLRTNVFPALIFLAFLWLLGPPLIVGVELNFIKIFEANLTVCLGFTLGIGLVIGSLFSFGRYITIGFEISREEVLLTGLVLAAGASLMIALGISLQYELQEVAKAASFGLFLGLLIGYFRIFEYPIHLWRASRNKGFQKSPFVNNQIIWIPLHAHQKNLLKEAQKTPLQARSFLFFLLRHRPLQRRFAYQLWHAMIAGNLKNSLVAFTTPWSTPQVSIGSNRVLIPEPNWDQAITHLLNCIKTYVQETNGNLKLSSLNKMERALFSFEQINLTADPKWNHLYFNCIKHLKSEVASKKSQLIQSIAPIAQNPYQVGDALEPGRDNTVFLDREDLKNQLEFIIHNAQQMPLFLVRGQRRVGKTSLLKFLPHILGPGFKVVFLDLQGADYCPDIPGWLNAIRREVNSATGKVEEEIWQAEDNWLKAWGELEAHLSLVAQECRSRIIICFDEYEALQGKGFTDNIAEAEKLLAAMRSFSQHQSVIIFLFTGALYFDEIKQPDWAKYFVNSKPLEVSYLSKEKTLQLITAPYPDFPIQYEEGLPMRIYELTQGHPALTQEICSHLVDLANQGSKHDISLNELEQVIDEKIVVVHNHSLNRFWNEFCYNKARKETVRQLIRGESFTDIPALRSLLRHKFIIKETDGSYRMCAPLFRQYIEAVDDSFFEV